VICLVFENGIYGLMGRKCLFSSSGQRQIFMPGLAFVFYICMKGLWSSRDHGIRVSSPAYIKGLRTIHRGEGGGFTTHF